VILVSSFCPTIKYKWRRQYCREGVWTNSYATSKDGIRIISLRLKHGLQKKLSFKNKKYRVNYTISK
jgi:hypothetical protein